MKQLVLSLVICTTVLCSCNVSTADSRSELTSEIVSTEVPQSNTLSESQNTSEIEETPSEQISFHPDTEKYFDYLSGHRFWILNSSNDEVEEEKIDLENRTIEDGFTKSQMIQYSIAVAEYKEGYGRLAGIPKDEVFKIAEKCFGVDYNVPKESDTEMAIHHDT